MDVCLTRVCVISSAIRSTTDTAGRLSRKDMEREVASGMLVTRLAESGTLWQRNRYRAIAIREITFDRTTPVHGTVVIK